MLALGQGDRAMKKVRLAVIVAIAAALSSGCGTICNLTLSWAKDKEDRGPQPYGGVQTDVAILEKLNLGGLHLGGPTAGNAKSGLLAVGVVGLLLMDPALSFVGDTLTLPIPLYLQDRRCRARKGDNEEDINSLVNSANLLNPANLLNAEDTRNERGSALPLISADQLAEVINPPAASVSSVPPAPFVGGKAARRSLDPFACTDYLVDPVNSVPISYSYVPPVSVDQLLNTANDSLLPRYYPDGPPRPADLSSFEVSDEQ
jgi:hypothetical protein